MNDTISTEFEYIYIFNMIKLVWNQRISTTPSPQGTPPKRRMKETLFTRHRSTVEPMLIANDKKATLQAIHTMAVNQAVTNLRRNVVLDDCPPIINISEK